jgi:solute carrier family 39 (zinc transporter), member 7
MFVCKVTKAHLLVNKFDQLMKPLPQTAQAICSTIIISVVPIFLIYAMNSCFMRTKEQREVMTQYLISFAIGGLLGDVFFHTLPHMSSGGHDHGHGHSHGEDSHGHSDPHGQSHHHSHGDHGHSHNPEDMLNNLIIIVGILSFFLIEKFT